MSPSISGGQVRYLVGHATATSARCFARDHWPVGQPSTCASARRSSPPPRTGRISSGCVEPSRDTWSRSHDEAIDLLDQAYRGTLTAVARLAASLTASARGSADARSKAAGGYARCTSGGARVLAGNDKVLVVRRPRGHTLACVIATGRSRSLGDTILGEGETKITVRRFVLAGSIAAFNWEYSREEVEQGVSVLDLRGHRRVRRYDAVSNVAAPLWRPAPTSTRHRWRLAGPPSTGLPAARRSSERCGLPGESRSHWRRRRRSSSLGAPGTRMRYRHDGEHHLAGDHSGFAKAGVGASSPARPGSCPRPAPRPVRRPLQRATGHPIRALRQWRGALPARAAGARSFRRGTVEVRPGT